MFVRLTPIGSQTVKDACNRGLRNTIKHWETRSRNTIENRGKANEHDVITYYFWTKYTDLHCSLRWLHERLSIKMVQLFYYESRGQCARRILRHEGHKTKVLLYPYEGWAQPASLTYWIIKTSWWSRTKCNIIQVRHRPNCIQKIFDFLKEIDCW